MDVDVPSILSALAGAVTGSGGAIAVMYLWLRDKNRQLEALERDRDWWRTFGLNQRVLTQASLGGLEAERAAHG